MQPNEQPIRPPAQPQLRWRDVTPRSSRAAGWASLSGADRVRTTYSGRGAIYQYLAALRAGPGRDPRRKRVLVPAFHCPTVVDPILHAGYEVRYYGIDCALDVVAEDLLRKLDDTVAAALFIRYFGVVAPDRALFAACRAAGAAVIDDCSHGFLAASPLRLADFGADATIYSFWKLVPCRVGGGVLMPTASAEFAWPPEGRANAQDSLARIRILGGQLGDPARAAIARLLRRRLPPEEVRPVILKAASEAYPYDPSASTWGMPATARLILANADLQSLAEARRRNYTLLGENVAAGGELTPMRPTLPPDACPWGFPMLLARRAERDYLLRASGVPVFSFGEVLHPSVYDQCREEPGVLAAAEYLSGSLLAIAVHQGIFPERVRQIAGIVNRFAERF